MSMTREQEEVRAAKLQHVIPMRIPLSEAQDNVSTTRRLLHIRRRANIERQESYQVFLAQCWDFTELLRKLSHNHKKDPAVAELFMTECMGLVLNSGCIVDKEYFFPVLGPPQQFRVLGPLRHQSPRRTHQRLRHSSPRVFGLSSDSGLAPPQTCRRRRWHRYRGMEGRSASSHRGGGGLFGHRRRIHG